MSEHQEEAPMDLKASVSAVFIPGRSSASLYELLRIPYRYMDSVDDFWERLQKEAERDALEKGEELEPYTSILEEEN
jgi:hypothetical protein